MKIISNFTQEKESLPKGKLTAKWVYSRGVYQVYLGGRYLYGVAGDTEEACYQDLESRYDTEGRKIDFKPSN